MRRETFSTVVALILLFVSALSSGLKRQQLLADVVSTPQQDESPEQSPNTQKTGMPSEIEAKILQPWTGDFNGMVKRRLIRALVVYSKTMYFLDKAEEKGITYEALKEFEKQINEKLNKGHLKVHLVFVLVGRDQLISGLMEGRGDLAVANLTITPGRLKFVDFSDPVYDNVSELIVTGPVSPSITTLDDLAGKEIYIRQSSSYFESLKCLNELFRKSGKAEIKIQFVSEYLESEDILEMVNSGIYPITVIDSHVGEFWSKVYNKIHLHKNIPINTSSKIGWAFRKNSPELKTVVNKFVKTHKKGTLFGNILLKKYLRTADWIKNNVADKEIKKFQAVVELFQKYATMYDFDYLMITAQAYQESRLEQNTKSPSGAVGIMQLLPSTAADSNVNIPGINTVENNIHAGVKYMRFILNRYFKDEPMDQINKHLFAFASYNAGPAKISSLRRKAATMGLNPHVWFRNVEVVAARDIGRETVQYVSNIFKYYLAYEQIIARQKIKETVKTQ